MNKSNTYIFIYATILVVLVAALLASAATVLKPFQQKNLEIAKKMEILHAIDKGWDAGSADSKNKYVESEYDKYITQVLVLKPAGDSVGDRKGFDVEMKDEMKKDSLQRVFPVFVSTLDDGSKSYIFAVRGKGLWGPIWGYVALGPDLNTIVGAFFDHEGETPGLGAEINTRIFQSQFKAKKIFDESGKYVSVMVLKSNEPKIPEHSVDAISGGTITSKGLEAMVFDSMENYLPFIKKLKI